MTIGPEELPPTTPDGRSTLAALALEDRKRLLARLQEEAAAAAHTISAVDELIADRRAEAAREEVDAPLP